MTLTRNEKRWLDENYEEILAYGLKVGPNKRIQIVNVYDMEVDYSYQRSHRESQVVKMKKNFDPDAVGVVTLAKRRGERTGRKYVLDGQSRIDTIKRRAEEADDVDAKVLALVHHGTTAEQEAKKYELMNTNKPVTGNNKFKSRHRRKERPELDIVEKLAEYGLEPAFLSPGHNANDCGPMAIRGESRLISAWKVSPYLFDKALVVLTGAFVQNGEVEHKAATGEFIYSMVKFLNQQASINTRLITRRLKPASAADMWLEAEQRARSGWNRFDEMSRQIALRCGFAHPYQIAA